MKPKSSSAFRGGSTYYGGAHLQDAYNKVNSSSGDSSSNSDCKINFDDDFNPVSYRDGQSESLIT